MLHQHLHVMRELVFYYPGRQWTTPLNIKAHIALVLVNWRQIPRRKHDGQGKRSRLSPSFKVIDRAMSRSKQPRQLSQL